MAKSQLHLPITDRWPRDDRETNTTRLRERYETIRRIINQYAIIKFGST